MLAIDTVLQGRYRIVQQLGQGGMGAVYKAIDERLNKTVAIKEIIFEFETAADENHRNLRQKAFEREAHSLVKARHEAVPDITDYFSELERSYFVMEFVEGDDLAKMLEKRGHPFSFEEVAPWMNQLLETLEYLHNLKPPILHRDIKPQNLKLNERQKIKLLDFGVARSSDKSSAGTQQTFLAATLNYAPLEQVLRVISPVFREYILLQHRDKAQKFLAQDTDVRCDIFGVGATFYHLLTNQIPVDVTERALGIWEKGTDELVNPSVINPEIPPDVSRWLLKAMAFERENRFASASEMRQALQQITAENTERFSLTGQPAVRQEVMTTGEQRLMQAKTESLIESKITEGEISPPDKLSSTAGSVGLIAPTDDFKFSDTDFPAQTASDDSNTQSYINEKLFVKPTEPEYPSDQIIPPPPEEPATNNRKYILALSLIAILVFATGAVGLYAVISLIIQDKTPEENNTTIENKSLPQTPEPTPVVTETVYTTEGNTEIITETNTETIPNTAKKETPTTPTITAQPTAAPTSTIIVEQKPTPTPTAKPTATRTPPNVVDYVVCYVRASDGTTSKIRKKSCNECPEKSSCELIFKPYNPR